MKTKMSGGTRSRITLDQRRLMLEFIKQNPVIATGRFEGADGAKKRSKLLNEMANILNSQGSGATKTSEKWLRSWQDWKSDTKRKAAEIARQAQGTGTALPSYALSELERDLVDLVHGTSISGLKLPEPLIPGPSQSEKLQIKSEEPQKQLQLIDADPELEVTKQNHIPTIIKKPQQKRNKRKILKGSMDTQMVAAIERQANSSAAIARQIGKLADVGLIFLKVWCQLKNIDPEELSKPFSEK